MTRADWFNVALCAEARSDSLYLAAHDLARQGGPLRSALALIDRRWREIGTGHTCHALAYRLWIAGAA